MKRIEKNQTGGMFEKNYRTRGENIELNFSKMPSFRSRRCPLYLHFVGHEIMFRDNECIRHHSPRCGLEYIQDGNFSLWANDKWFELNPGDLLFLPPNTQTRLRCSSSRGVKKMLAFSGAALAHICELLRLQDIPPQQVTDPEKWNNYFQRAREICDSSDIFNIENLLFAYEVLWEYSEFNSTAKLPEKLKSILEWAEGSINHQVTLDTISKRFHVSISSLYRLFRKHTGKNPIEYISQLRLERATELLQSGNFLIKEVAAQLNYSSQQYFSAEFKKFYGISPKNYLDNFKTSSKKIEIKRLERKTKSMGNGSE